MDEATTTKNKVVNKKNFKRLTSLLLVFALVITGLFAFLTSTDTKTNVFTVGSVQEELWEKFDTNNDGTINETEYSSDNTAGEIFNASTKQPDTVENVLPGDTIIKAPYVKNTGANDAWTYVSVAIPVVKTSVITAEDDGTIGLKSDDELKIIVKSYGIQPGYTDEETETAQGVWMKYVTGNETADPSTLITSAKYDDMFGAARTEDENDPKVPAFTLFSTVNGETVAGINSTEWEQIGGIYKTDSYNVYVYKYTGTHDVSVHNGVGTVNHRNNTLEPMGTSTDGTTGVTANVFDFVKLATYIGESSSDNIKAKGKEAETYNTVTFVKDGTTVATANYYTESDDVDTPDLASVQWVTESGALLSSATTYAASEYLTYNVDGSGSLYIENPDPVVTALSSTSSTTTVKLKAKDGSTTAIERNGVVETYNTYTTYPNNVSSDNVKEPDAKAVTPGADGFTNYFIYGFNGAEWDGTFDETAFSQLLNGYDTNGLTSDEVLRNVMSEYLEVYVTTTDSTGTASTKTYSLAELSENSYGYVEFSNYGVSDGSSGKYRYTCGTGMKITVYDSGNNIVEAFTVVLTLDADNSGHITSADTSAARNIAANIAYTDQSKIPAIVKALDIDHNNVITDDTEVATIRQFLAGVYYINDTNQTVVS